MCDSQDEISGADKARKDTDRNSDTALQARQVSARQSQEIGKTGLASQ